MTCLSEVRNQRGDRNGTPYPDNQTRVSGARCSARRVYVHHPASRLLFGVNQVQAAVAIDVDGLSPDHVGVKDVASSLRRTRRLRAAHFQRAGAQDVTEAAG